VSRILLTGASGLVGGRLATLLADRHAVFCVGRHARSPIANVTSIVVDLASDWSVAVLPERIDAVVHLAQSNRWQDFPDGALDIFAVNTATTAKLLDYAVRAGGSRFVLASTGGLYGSVAGAITELTPVTCAAGPLQFYFETKRAAEALALSYAGRLSVSVLRPFFIYGPGQRQPKLVPRLIERIRAGDTITLRGPSGTQLNPAHVDDVAAAIDACLSGDHHGVLNLGGGQVTSIRSMVNRIADTLGVAVTFATESNAADSFVTDVTRMRSLIGREPIGFDDGIATLLAAGDRS
jgi:nucleoside-diphosphate-sugar epimerase